jgi:hypothetical protein
MQVLDHGGQVEALELLGVVELLAHRIGQGRVPVKDLNVQLARPPVSVGVRLAEGALACALVVCLGVHCSSPIVFWFFPLGIQGSSILGN